MSMFGLGVGRIGVGPVMGVKLGLRMYSEDRVVHHR